jgi:uncharacterized protein YhjY with autotransporter beta-barrel domain
MKPILIFAGCLAAFVYLSPLAAQTSVGSASDLQAAIDGGATNIVLTNDINVAVPIYIGTATSPTITINGGGFTVDGGAEVFFVQSGTITIRNVTLSGNAVGGSGGQGSVTGGGALGAGGAIFVGSAATVTASGVQFSNNSATGGSAGPMNGNGYSGGGGLNGGTGGVALGAGSGGGGGNGGTGGASTFNNTGGGGGGLLSPGGGGFGSGGGNGGGPFAGTGAVDPNNPSTVGGVNSGGGGGTATLNGSNGGTNGGGGAGGGGSSTSSAGSGGNYAGGGAGAGSGGAGGFGGAGGAGGTGGNGRFGAGGGGAFFTAGTGGVGGTDGSINGFPISGGAGAGLGGAVFVQAGGTFIVTGNQTFSGNSVAGGNGNGTAAAAGSDLFSMTSSTTTIAPGPGKTITFNGSIADDSSPSLPSNAGYEPGFANGASIVIGSAGHTGGTVVFNVQDTFSGGLTIGHGVTVQAGAQFALGTGAVTLQGGTLTMGHGVHALTVAAYTQSGGSLQLAVNGSGHAATADSLTVVDQNNTNLGGTLALKLNDFTVPTGGHGQTFTFTLLTTPNGYHGQFAAVDALGLPSGLRVTLDYAADDVILDISQVQGFALVGLSANQQAILAPINRTALGNLTPGFTKLFNALTPLGANPSALGAALDQLSPLKFGNFSTVTAFNNEIFTAQAGDDYLAGQRSGPHGTFMGGNGQIDSSGLVVSSADIDPTLSMVHSRLLAFNQPAGLSDLPSPLLAGVDMKEMKAPVSRPWNVFLRGNVVLAQGFSQADIPHFDDNTESVVAGADYRLTPNFLVGATLGYAHTDATLDTFNSSATVDSYSPGLYAAYANHGWYANFQGQYAYNSYTEERKIDFLHQTANGATGGNEGGADLDGGYEFHHGAWTYGPLAGVHYTHLTVNGYDESGSDANLAVREDQADSLRSRLGFTLRYSLCNSTACLTPHLNVSWQHEFMDSSRGLSSSFTNFGGGDFTVRTPGASDDFALIDAGLDAQVTPTITVFGDYTVQAGQDDYFGQSVQAGVKIGF